MPGEAERALSDIHRLAIPTPFPVGRVNAYLIEDEPLTLVDCGPNSARALDELETALAAHGRRIEELQLLLITHQHADHVGLASVIARRSGAEVAALAGLAEHLADGGSEGKSDMEFVEAVMLEHGVQQEVVLALRAGVASLRAFSSRVEVSRRLLPGESVQLAKRSLRVLHRPGHSPSDTLFFDEAAAIVLTGDHLLAQISSNPIITRPLGAGPDFTGPRPKALCEYIASLKETAAMPRMLCLPGHGEPVQDHRALIEQRMRMHERRAQKILGLMGSERMSAHEIAVRMWDKAAYTQTFLTLSEVLGHLDLLIERQLVAEVPADEHGIVRFQALGAR